MHYAIHYFFPLLNWEAVQCIWCRPQKAGLASDYSSDPEVKKFVWRTAVLPLLPQEQVGRLMAGYNGRQSKWRDDCWGYGLCYNHLVQRSMEPRNVEPTNNHLEGWQHKLNQVVKKAIKYLQHQSLLQRFSWVSWSDNYQERGNITLFMRVFVHLGNSFWVMNLVPWIIVIMLLIYWS